MDHPPEIQLHEFLNGQLDDDKLEAVGVHVESCSKCRQEIETVQLRGDTFVSQLKTASRAIDHGDELDDLQRATQTVGNDYECTGVLGRGGMGVVVSAFDKSLKRPVAIKILAPQLAADPDAISRFLREARAAAAVRHENVAEIHAIDESGRLPYIVMELIEGKTLQQRLDSANLMEVEEIVAVGNQIAHGLDAAHRAGLIHRDIKPANILIDDETGKVKLTDFGLARAVDDFDVTRTGQVLGTPAWMSPEQAQGEPADERSDLFSLGSVLYAMCTGTAPFRAATSVAVLRAVCDDQPVPIRRSNPEVSAAMVNLINRLMAKDPQKRPASAIVVAKELMASHRRNVVPVSRTALAGIILLALTVAILASPAVNTQLMPSSSDVTLDQATHLTTTAHVAAHTNEQPADLTKPESQHSATQEKFPKQLLPADDAIDVISCLVNSETFSRRKRLSTHGDEIHMRALDAGNFLRVPLRIDGDYELSLKFVRLYDDQSKGSCNIILPIRNKHLAFVLNGSNRQFEGCYAGFGRINDTPPWSHETTVPASITTGQQHCVDVRVESDDLTATVAISLDGQPLTSWTGPRSQLGTPFTGRFMKNGFLEFGAWGHAEFAFRELRLKMTSGSAELDK